MRNTDQVKFVSMPDAPPDILDQAKSSHKAGRLCLGRGTVSKTPRAAPVARLEEYVATAAMAIRDPDALASLRASLRRRILASPLCNGERFARRLESVFATMWRQHLQGVRRSFLVQAVDLELG